MYSSGFLGRFFRLYSPLTTLQEAVLHPREYLLGKAKLLLQRGEPIPLDMLAEAEQLGLVLDTLEDQQHNANSQEGDILNGTKDYI
jgi:hypothetical protein